MGKSSVDYKKNTKLPWVEETQSKDGRDKYKLLCPVLADFIRQKHDFLFVKERIEDDTQRFVYKDGYYQHISNEELQRIIYQYVPLCLENSRHIEEIMKLIYLGYGMKTYSDINPENLINFKNGVLDIHANKLLPHSKKYFITIRIPVNYKRLYEKPKTSYFDDYLNHLCYGKNDRKKFLLECMGLVISNIDCSHLKKALIMFGDHNTGKSKIKELLVELIGNNNYSAQDMSSLESRTFATSQIFNKRLIGTNDMSFVTVKELKIFKQITGGDTIAAEYKHKNGFNFRFTGFLWLCCNQLPKFGGDHGDGVYDRIITLECSNLVVTKDKKLLAHMLMEKDYIVCKAIEALQGVIKNNYNLSIPQDCLSASEQYKIENDSVLSFIRDCVVEFDVMKLHPKQRYTTKQVYDVYIQYCKDNNRGHAETNKEFKRIIDKKGIGETKKINQHYYKNITLNEWCIHEYTNDDVPDELKHMTDYSNDERQGKQLSDLTVDKIVDMIRNLSEIEKTILYKELDTLWGKQVKIKDAEMAATKASIN